MRLKRKTNENNVTMRAGKHPITGMVEIYLTPEEAEQMKQMVRGASLPHRQVFHKLLETI